jgi:hypothetical protein
MWQTDAPAEDPGTVHRAAHMWQTDAPAEDRGTVHR